MPTVTVRRDSGWADKIRKYRIILDGVEVGKLGEGAVLRQEVCNGLHTIAAKIDWCGSRPLQFDAKSRDQVVVVKSALRGWCVFLGLFIHNL
jgi:hypothetical protein